MERKMNLILSAEESFARRVALGLIVEQSKVSWLQAIPGMFIIDFLRRTRFIRQYMGYYMFPRRLAMDEAIGLKNGRIREHAPDADKMIRVWLEKSRLYSRDIGQGYLNLTHFLAGHYAKLLQQDAENYVDLVIATYGSRGGYDRFLIQLSSQEAALRQTILANMEASGMAHDFRHLEQAHLENQRRKELETIFS